MHLKLIPQCSFKDQNVSQTLSQSHVIRKILKSKAPQRKQSAVSACPEVSDVVSKTSYKMYEGIMRRPQNGCKPVLTLWVCAAPKNHSVCHNSCPREAHPPATFQPLVENRF